MTYDAHILANTKAVAAIVSAVAPRDDSDCHVWRFADKGAVTAELHTSAAAFAEFLARVEAVDGIDFVREAVSMGGTCVERFYNLCGVAVCAQFCAW